MFNIQLNIKPLFPEGLRGDDMQKRETNVNPHNSHGFKIPKVEANIF